MITVRHCLSIYEYEGKRYAEAWILVKIFKKRFALWRRKEEIPERKPLLLKKLQRAEYRIGRRP